MLDEIECARKRFAEARVELAPPPPQDHHHQVKEKINQIGRLGLFFVSQCLQQ